MAINFSNIFAARSIRELDTSSKALERSFTRLSSGLRINSAADDAAGLAISSQLTAQSRIFGQGIRNINDGISALNISDSTLSSFSNVTARLKELATQASSSTLTLSQRRGLSAEADALVNEFNRLVSSTNFNGRLLLDGSATSLGIQAGIGNQSQIDAGVGSQLARTAGAGTFKSNSSVYSYFSLSTMLSGDFNNDGKIDVVTGQSIGNGTILVQIGNGSGGVTATKSTSLTGNAAISLQAAYDLNGDGNLDLVWNDTANGGLKYSAGNGDGTFASPVTLSGNAASGLAIGDFNGDSRADIVSTRAGGSDIILSTGAGTWAGATSGPFSAGSTGAVAGDFNGDGKLDAAALTAGSSVAISLGTGNGTFKNATNTSISGTATSIVASDFNNDGIVDLAAAGSGGLSVLINNGSGGFTLGTTSATAATTLFTGDFNNDGVTDLVTNTSTYFGNRDGTFQSRLAHTGAGTGSWYAVGDWNGDSILDFFNSDTSQISAAYANTTSAYTHSYINLLTTTDARSALTTLEATMVRIGLEQGAIGGKMQRLAAGLSNLQASKENFEAASSRITDVDVAEESANLLSKQILQQAGAAILAQTTRQTNLALTLLQ